MASYFSVNSDRKVTKRTPPGLDKGKSDRDVGFTLSKPKTASLAGSIYQGRLIACCRAEMRVNTTRWQ